MLDPRLLSVVGSDAHLFLVFCTMYLFLSINMTYSVETVVYLNIRVQNEGLNRDVLLGDLYGVAPEGKDVNYALIEKGGP